MASACSVGRPEVSKTVTGARRSAREGALQMLYQIDVSGVEVEAAIEMY